jgi:hypothetical protein
MYMAVKTSNIYTDNQLYAVMISLYHHLRSSQAHQAEPFLESILLSLCKLDRGGYNAGYQDRIAYSLSAQ